jgi:hypothetical protein
MTDRIIAFESYRRREHPSPSRIGLHLDRSGSMRNATTPGSTARSTGILKLQVARIARLLDELEDVARLSGDFPQAIAARGYSGLERARGDLPSRPGFEREAGQYDLEDDPQPEIDGDMLERMYRQLDPDS